MFFQLDVIGTRMMKLVKSVSILSIMGIFRDLAFITLALFTLSALMLSLVLLLSDSLWMQAHYRICQAALKPEVCELRETTPRLPQVSLET